MEIIIFIKHFKVLLVSSVGAQDIKDAIFTILFQLTEAGVPGPIAIISPAVVTVSTAVNVSVITLCLQMEAAIVMGIGLHLLQAHWEVVQVSVRLIP